MQEQIPDKNIFMMCSKLNHDAVSKMPKGFHVRYCRENELDTWKALHFDTPELAEEYYDYMTQFFYDVYLPKGDLFYKRCLFVCNADDHPVGTCFVWKSYNAIWTLQWFKVLKEFEGRGIGRALLSIVMTSLTEDELPLFLHTQPSSYRAIKLYSDFGFHLISDPVIGSRRNEIDECMPILKKYMPTSDYNKLRFVRAPQFFLNAVGTSDINEF